VKKIIKTNSIVGDRGGKIAAIRDAVSKASIIIEFQLKQGYPKKKPTYQQDPLQ